MATDVTDLASIDAQFLLFGYCLTDWTPAREALTRLNEAHIAERTRTVDLSERYWDRTMGELRRSQWNGEPVPWGWALAGTRLRAP